MYLSRKIVNDGYEYFLAQSYFEAPYWRSKIIYPLGKFPEQFIEYYSEVAFYIPLEDILRERGIETNQDELEEIFFRFLSPEAKTCLRSPLNRKRRKVIKIDRNNLKIKELHSFDIIRFLVLKLGISNPQNFLEVAFPFLIYLQNKSRDEIENFLWDMEDELPYREKLRYIFNIFNLDFSGALEERDQRFLEEVCKISEDEKYRMGLSKEEVLGRYLSRYIWFYFDVFKHKERPKIYNLLEKELYEELAKILETSLEKLVSLSKREVITLFRKKAQKLHPDKGGSHEEFIKLRNLLEKYLKVRFGS